MQSTAPTVDAYLTEVPSDRLVALTELRRLCREHLAGFEEGMVYFMFGSASALPLAAGGEARFSVLQCDKCSVARYNTNI